MARIVIQVVAQQRGEAGDHVLGLGRIFHYQGTDGIQAIEQEVWIDLRLQSAQLGLAQSKFEADLLLLSQRARLD